MRSFIFRKLVLSLFLYFYLSGSCDAITSPQIRCVSVASNGDVSLTWSVPVGTADSYHVFSSKSLSGFTEIFNTSDNTLTTCTHTGAGASGSTGSIVYYYIQSVVAGVSSPPIDTVQSIYLKVSNPGTGFANLSWNPMHNPALSGSSVWYRVLKEYPVGVWKLIDSTKTFNYQDTINVCSAFINYKIEISDSSSCTSASSVDGNLFKDLNPPSMPFIDSASVNSQGKSVLGWKSGNSKDIKGYIIYRQINGVLLPVDSVYNGSSGFIDWASRADSSSESYWISSIDSCGNLSALTNPHQTLFVAGTINICKSQTYLSWNKYINMPSGLGGYRIYVSTNGAPPVLLATNAPNETTFTHDGVSALSNYCYYVQVFNTLETITATSNVICISAATTRQAQYFYLRVATVKNGDAVEIKAYVDSTADIAYYNILRSDNSSGTFVNVGKVNFSSASLLTFIDGMANANTQSYFYKVVAVDSCGNDRIETDTCKTIFLQVQENEDMTNTLKWNDYEGWPGGVSIFNVYRAIDGVFDPLALATISNTSVGLNEYTDDVSNFISDKGAFSYYIQAMEDAGNPYSFKDSSLSNVVEVYQNPRIHIPNAFAPDGVNTVFIPVNSFVDKTEYSFRIFNRWGENIWETDNYNIGWNGTDKAGKEVREGVFIYWVKFKTASGKYIEKQGSVTLLK